MTEQSPELSPPRPLTQAFCPMCSRTTYVREDAEMVCPVCSSPLLVTATVAEESQAS